MIRSIVTTILLALVVTLSVVVSKTQAATSAEILTAYESLTAPSLDSAMVFHLVDQEIVYKDFVLELDSGFLYLFDPIMLDAEPVSWGGLFVGQARVRFTPGIKMEQEQLWRYFGADSLNVRIKEVELCLDRATLARLGRAGRRSDRPITERVRSSVDEHHQFLLSRQGRNMLWSILKGIVEQGSQSFVLANSALGKFGQSVYLYDPLSSEEVSLYVNPWERVAERTLTLVCGYSNYSNGKAATINGLNKDQISVSHYDIVTRIDSKAKISVEASLTCLIERPIQVVRLTGPTRMNIDSVRLNDNEPVAFVTIEDSASNRSDLWLAFERIATPGDTVRLKFYGQPDLPSRLSAGYIEMYASNWFPVYSNQRASFSMEFHTPRDQTLVVSGKMMTRQVTRNELVTLWTQELPSSRVCFSLGLNRTYNFTNDKGSPVGVAYNPRLIIDRDYTLDREKQIAEELSNAMALLSHNFGPYQFSTVTATPMPGLVSESFPSVIALGARTLGQTEKFTADPYLYSSMIAAQWWGAVVDHRGYHDAWLTYGLVRYSAYMYLQATRGNPAVFELLDRDADDIFSACPHFLSSTRECGPLALGERTAGINTTEISELVIYRKAAWVFHMLRNMLLDLGSMSDELFLDMMREWYRTKKGKLVSTAEFIQLTEKYTKADMDWFFDQFIYGTELPTYHFSYELNQLPDGRTQAICNVRQEGVSDNFKMYVPLEIEFVTGQRAYLRLLIDQPRGEIELPPIDGRVKSLRLNPFRSVLGRVVTE